MSDQRRVRFGSIDGLGREDVALAGEIWLETLIHAPWASREAMKLGAVLVRYMANPDPDLLLMREIERELQMTRDDIQRALVLMRTFAAIDGYALDRDDLKVALSLTQLLRLKVLETRKRLTELTETVKPAQPVRETRWVPPPVVYNEPLVPADVAPLVAMISEHIRQAAAKRDDARIA